MVAPCETRLPSDQWVLLQKGLWRLSQVTRERQLKVGTL